MSLLARQSGLTTELQIQGATLLKIEQRQLADKEFWGA